MIRSTEAPSLIVAVASAATATRSFAPFATALTLAEQRRESPLSVLAMAAARSDQDGRASLGALRFTIGA